MKFTEMGLSPDTLKSVQALGFETPTPIQEKAIPILLEGKRDFVGLASTGTGKTAAFGLPLLEAVDPFSIQFSSTSPKPAALWRVLVALNLLMLLHEQSKNESLNLGNSPLFVERISFHSSRASM